MNIKLKSIKKWKKNRFFPFFTSIKNQNKYFAIVGLGSNIPPEEFYFKKLFYLLTIDKRIKILNTSPMLINEAFGFRAQRDFLNAVILIQTKLHARELLKVLLYYEFKFRRKRSFKNAPRILDLDLLYFSKKTKNDDFCTVPHIGAANRLSVILPLSKLKNNIGVL